jgi:hypothetical protein
MWEMYVPDLDLKQNLLTALYRYVQLHRQDMKAMDAKLGLVALAIAGKCANDSEYIPKVDNVVRRLIRRPSSRRKPI